MDSLLFLSGLVATEGLLKELSLGIAGWEVDQDPTNRVSPLKLLELIVQSLLLCFESLDLLSLKVLLLELILDVAKPVIDLDLTACLLLHLPLL